MVAYSRIFNSLVHMNIMAVVHSSLLMWKVLLLLNIQKQNEYVSNKSLISHSACPQSGGKKERQEKDMQTNTM